MARSSDTKLKFEFDEHQVKPSPPLSASAKKRSQWTKLEYLLPGDRFEIKGLETNFRDLYVLRISESSVSVKGECKIYEDEEFKPLSKGYCMACSATVRRI